MSTPLRIALVGTGNVASRLSPLIAAHPDYEIAVIASRTLDHARRLAENLGIDTAVTDKFRSIGDYKPDIVLISLADNALEEVIASIGRLEDEPLVVHTSGTLDRSLLAPASPRTGILYPLQTFTAGREVDIQRIPVFTEAESDADQAIVDRLATAISDKVHHTDPARRKTLHIAGVFTNNFTNILLEQVEKLLARDGYGLDVVRPLMEETVAKAFAIGPHAAQTGPAKRGDQAVIEAHIAALPDELKGVYASLSDLITASHTSHE